MSNYTHSSVCVFALFSLPGSSMKTSSPWKTFMKARITCTWSCSCKYRIRLRGREWGSQTQMSEGPPSRERNRGDEPSEPWERALRGGVCPSRQESEGLTGSYLHQTNDLSFSQWNPYPGCLFCFLMCGVQTWLPGNTPVGALCSRL